MVAGWRFWQAYVPGVRAVTREDVQRVTQKYLTPENRTVGVVVPGQAAGNGEHSAVRSDE